MVAAAVAVTVAAWAAVMAARGVHVAVAAAAVVGHRHRMLHQDL